MASEGKDELPPIPRHNPTATSPTQSRGESRKRTRRGIVAFTMAKASWPILRVATGPCRLSSRTKTNGHTQSATASGVSAAPICCGCIRSPVGAEAKSGKSSAMPMTVKWFIAISAMQSRTRLRPKLPSAATLSEQQRRTSKKHRRWSGHKQRPPQHRVQTPPRRCSPLLLSPAFATRAACAAVAKSLRPGKATSAAAPSSPPAATSPADSCSSSRGAGGGASRPGKEGAAPISKSRRLVRLLPGASAAGCPAPALGWSEGGSSVPGKQEGWSPPTDTVSGSALTAGRPSRQRAAAARLGRRYGYTSRGEPAREGSTAAGRASEPPIRGPSMKPTPQACPSDANACDRCSSGISSRSCARSTAWFALRSPPTNRVASAAGSEVATPRPSVLAAAATIPKLMTGRRPMRSEARPQRSPEKICARL
mmetsp:Transcript_8598/g.27257  ORF Transcript_8598/g.27257 Transcript_8598/m.27257 type:complete len:424 (+) Transcript_8598:417-1688(+)